MGVDPDNHRLTQKAPLRRSRSSHGATLSTDAVSSYENMKCNSTALPDLNLDLTICTPSALEGQRLEKTATPTLLLFQDAGNAERRGKKLKEKATDAIGEGCDCNFFSKGATTLLVQVEKKTAMSRRSRRRRRRGSSRQR
ncbi:hypothetical protein BHM03_00039587 [Ensete ventricosum]|nr:hypothetical protein BHM03_00039587 [Ensete ventricosum]